MQNKFRIQRHDDDAELSAPNRKLQGQNRKCAAEIVDLVREFSAP